MHIIYGRAGLRAIVLSCFVLDSYFRHKFFYVFCQYGCIAGCVFYEAGAVLGCSQLARYQLGDANMTLHHDCLFWEGRGIWTDQPKQELQVFERQDGTHNGTVNSFFSIKVLVWGPCFKPMPVFQTPAHLTIAVAPFDTKCIW